MLIVLMDVQVMAVKEFYLHCMEKNFGSFSRIVPLRGYTTIDVDGNPLAEITMEE